MSRLKFSSNLFIELAEIEKIKKFLVDDGFKAIFQSIINKYGIFICQNQNNPLYAIANNSFAVQLKTGYSDVVTIGKGIGFDTDLNMIMKYDDTDMQIPNDGVRKWLVVEYDTHNFESGTIDVTSTGQVTGTGTDFKSVLRGYNNYPTKIKIESSGQLFEVVDVMSDTLAYIKINGAGSFSGERYSVVGAFTPGFIPDPNDILIYEYDHYKISLISSALPPALNPNQYLIAGMEFDANNILVVDDLRDEYFNSGTQTIEQITGNSFLSLVSVTVVNPPVRLNSNILNKSFELELNLQLNCEVLQYTIINPNQITITDIECNALNDTIPSGVDYFKDYILYNRTNGKTAVIQSSTNGQIDFGGDANFLTAGDELCILDKKFCDTIEFEVSNSGTPATSGLNKVFNTYLFDVKSKNVKIAIPMLSSDDPNITYNVGLRWKYTGCNISEQHYNDMPYVQFLNYLGISNYLDSNSSFDINPSLIINQITENYS